MAGRQETLIWLAPVSGIVDINERFPSPFGEEQQLDPVPLEDGVTWHLSPTERHRSLLRRYYDFYGDFYAASEAEIHVDADTVLEGDPALAEAPMEPYVLCFVMAASLHLDGAISSHMLRFQIDGEARPHSGFPKLEATRLSEWPEGTVIDVPTASLIAETYRNVRRAFARPQEHPSRRFAAAYRAAMGSTFVDPIPVLLCASLEAIAGSYKERQVIPRLLQYATSLDVNEVRRRLKRLYKLRHWFAHSAAIREMQSASNRATALQEGYPLAKEIVRNALAAS
jgi:hypothetical protein